MGGGGSVKEMYWVVGYWMGVTFILGYFFLYDYVLFAFVMVVLCDLVPLFVILTYGLYPVSSHPSCL